jgi:two-component system invasion response regulator UvrY
MHLSTDLRSQTLPTSSFQKARKESKLHMLVTYQHEVIKKAISYLLHEQFPDIELIFADHSHDLLVKLSSFPFNIVVLDVESTDSWYTPTIVNSLKVGHAGLKILIYSDLNEHIYEHQYLAAGADVYLSKKSSIEQLTDAIQQLLHTHDHSNQVGFQDVFHNDFLASQLNPFTKLSAREAQIVQWLVKGYTLIAISKLMGLNETTISTYKHRIFKKTKVSSLPGLIQLYSKFH